MFPQKNEELIEIWRTICALPIDLLPEYDYMWSLYEELCRRGLTGCSSEKLQEILLNSKLFS